MGLAPRLAQPKRTEQGNQQLPCTAAPARNARTRHAESLCTRAKLQAVHWRWDCDLLAYVCAGLEKMLRTRLQPWTEQLYT